MDVTYFAVISPKNLSHIVQYILAHWFPPTLDINSVNEGSVRAASASKTLLLRDACLSPHSPMPEVRQRRANCKKQPEFLDGQLHSSRYKRKRERLSNVYLPCSQTQNPVGVWKSRHFTCKLRRNFQSTL